MSDLSETLKGYADPQYKKELLGKGSLDGVISDLLDDAVRAGRAIDRLQEQLDKARGLLRYALADYSHPNFTDRYGMADRIRAALTDEQHQPDSVLKTADRTGEK